VLGREEAIAMTQPMRIDLGDQVRLRKQHTCGNDVWEVVRTGMDIRIKCLKCGRSVMLPRSQFEKQVKEFVKTSSQLG
jgi:hypothetical protein